MAHIFAEGFGLDPRIALVTERSASIADEAQVGKLLHAEFAGEALRVPVGVHGLDDTANDEFVAFATTRCKEHLEVMFTVLAAFKLVKDVIGEWSEALGTHKALSVPQLTIGVDNLLLGLEAVPTPSAGHGPQRHDV